MSSGQAKAASSLGEPGPGWAGLGPGAAVRAPVAMDEFLRVRLYSRREDIEPTIQRVLNYLSPWLRDDQGTTEQLRLALQAALDNAIVHGNLAIDALSGSVDSQSLEHRIQEREHNPEFLERCVTLEVRARQDAVTLSVEDLGSGFERQTPFNTGATGPAQALNPGGLQLIGQCMDEVQWNEIGNRITMCKRLN